LLQPATNANSVANAQKVRMVTVPLLATRLGPCAACCYVSSRRRVMELA
jgi:hypothetical protein